MVFKRDSNGMESTPKRVVVYGGNGFFGRVIVNELLRRSTTQIEIAARAAHSVEYAGYDYRVRFVESDLRLQNWLDQRHDFSRYVITDTNVCQGLAPLLHHQRLAHSPKHSTCARVPRRVAHVS